MRALLSKVVAGSMIAGAALLVSACHSETTAVVNNTTEVTEGDNVATTDEMMTTTDAANGAMMDNMATENTMDENAAEPTNAM